MKASIIKLTVAIMCFVCAMLFMASGCARIFLPNEDTYLTHIEIANGVDNKNPVYIECDILGDSVVELNYLQKCEIQVNKLYRSCNTVTINMVYKDVIIGHHFKIYRYNREEKDYFSFEAFRLSCPNDQATFDERINETITVHFFLYVTEEYFESNLK